MHADNGGEGGVMALVALVRNATRDRALLLPVASLLGVLGAGLFYGDSVMTPAISVLSAVEGLNAISLHVQSVVLPLALGILIALFAVQRFGTRSIGHFSGPSIDLRSEEHTSELQSRGHLVCRLLLEKKKIR